MEHDDLELEMGGKVLTERDKQNIGIYLPLNLNLVVDVIDGEPDRHYDFLRHVPFARCDN